MPDDTKSDNIKADTQATAEIRKIKRAQRNTLSPERQQQHSETLFKLTIKQKIYQNSQHIACYLANDAEIDPVRLIEHAWFVNKQVYLPVLSPLKNSLYFAPYAAGQPLKLNRYNIPEPLCHPSKWKTASQLNLLFLPLVAFDTQGNRLGMGGGFYDRTLAYLRHQHYWKKPKLVGLAHEIQKVAQLSRQNWDIPLDYIITEKQCYNARIAE